MEADGCQKQSESIGNSSLRVTYGRRWMSADTCGRGNGSPGWTRTNDQRINSPTLYRLSYRGTDRTGARILVFAPEVVKPRGPFPRRAAPHACVPRLFPAWSCCRHTTDAYDP